MFDRYNSKPAAVRAEQWNGTREHAERIIAAVTEQYENSPWKTEAKDPALILTPAKRADGAAVGLFIQVDTNNGPSAVLAGHWLVEGATDWYPCDPDTFAARWVKAT